MTQFYVGIKQVEAWPQEKDGQSGYAVKYPDGYTSWSPKETFENAYLPQGTDSSKVSPEMVEAMIQNFEVTDFDKKTTLVKATLKSGFTIIGHSSCVDPANYDRTIGASIATERIRNKLWEHLGFVFQWAKDGISV